MNGMHGGRDWNGNGKQDSFDQFIDYKIGSSNHSNSSSSHKDAHQAGNTKDAPQSNGTVIFKSLLTIGLCFAGFALPASADMGSLGAAICLLSAVAISALLWRK